MIPTLTRFVAALRREGHVVSPSEVIDASRALDLVGIEKRRDVRAALRATLAKTRAAAIAFDRLFDAFFVPPSREGKGEGKGRPGGRGDKPRPGTPERPGAVSRKPDLERESKSRPGAHEGERPGRREGRLRRTVRTRTARSASDPRKRILARRMTTEEERELAREVPKLVRELRLRVARRSARSSRGRPWIRRAMRENLQHGGVPFVLPMRSPKTKRTKVVLLVDVSHSVARSAGLFLLMASEFLSFGRQARVLAFVDKPVDATAALRRWARHGRTTTTRSASRVVRPGVAIVSGAVAFTDVLDGLEGLNLQAPSDYGRAFHSLLTSRLRPHGRDTVLVILGDGRTNRFDPLPWALEELGRGCAAVLWLVSEPASRWGTADSALPSYLPSADVAVEAADLDGLATGLAELVRRM